VLCRRWIKLGSPRSLPLGPTAAASFTAAAASFLGPDMYFNPVGMVGMLPGFFFHDVNDRADARAVSSIPFVASEDDMFQAHEVLDTHRGVCIWWATVELELERKVL